jgi:membrane protein
MRTHSEKEIKHQRPPVSHSMYTALKRLVHTMIMSIGVALTIGLFLVYDEYQQDWIDIQTAQPGRSMSEQYAKIIAPALLQEDRESIEALTAIAIQDPAILSLSVFDTKGKYLAFLPQVDSVVTLSRERTVPPVTYLQGITDDEGNTIGYLSVNIDTAHILTKPLLLRHQLDLIAAIIVALTLIIGVYLTRGFYKFRPWLLEALQLKTK